MRAKVTQVVGKSQIFGVQPQSLGISSGVGSGNLDFFFFNGFPDGNNATGLGTTVWGCLFSEMLATKQNRTREGEAWCVSLSANQTRLFQNQDPQACGGIFLINDWGGASPLGAVPYLGRWSRVCKKASWASYVEKASKNSSRDLCFSPVLVSLHTGCKLKGSGPQPSKCCNLLASCDLSARFLLMWWSPNCSSTVLATL